MLCDKALLLAGLVAASCVIPDVELDPSFDPDAGGSSGFSATSNNGGSGGKLDTPTKAGSSGASSSSSGTGTEAGGEPKGGSPSDGGNGGVKPSGGSGSVAPDPTAGAGGETDVPVPAAAVAKFCTYISISAADKLAGVRPYSEVVDLEIGSGAERVTISVDYYKKCAPEVGVACKAIPVGSAVPFRLVHHNSQIELATGVANISAGDAVLFTDFYKTEGSNYYAVTVEYEKNRFDAQECQALDYTDLFDDD
jgi:hypothetical protein